MNTKTVNGHFLKIGVCITFNPAFTHIFKIEDLHNDFKELSKIGYKGIELSLRDVDDLNWQTFNTEIEKNGLELTTLATGLVRKMDNISLMDENVEDRNKAVLRIKRMIEHISGYASSNKNILIGYIKGELSNDRVGNRRRIRYLSESLWNLLNFAQKKKVLLVLEVINHKETNFINNIASGLELISNFKSDYLKLAVDTFHINIDEKDSYKAIKEAGSKIGYVHLADENRKYPGSSNIDFESVLKALIEINYNGYLTMEFNPNNNMKDRFQSLDKSYHYIESLLQSFNKNNYYIIN